MHNPLTTPLPCDCVHGQRDVLYQHFYTFATDPDRMGRCLSIPMTWVMLVVFALVCNCMKDSVLTLTSTSSSLYSTFAVTGYRFASVLCSAIFLSGGNRPPATVIPGVALVLCGAFLNITSKAPKCSDKAKEA